MHDLHAAFGESVLVRNSVGDSMQLAIYRYAIFLLEPLSAQPSPPIGTPAHARIRRIRGKYHPALRSASVLIAFRRD